MGSLEEHRLHAAKRLNLAPRQEAAEHHRSRLQTPASSAAATAADSACGGEEGAGGRQDRNPWPFHWPVMIPEPCG